MSDILDAAVLLNGGRRRDALVRLAERMGVHVETVRRWTSGRAEMAAYHRNAHDAMVALFEAEIILARVREAVDERSRCIDKTVMR